MHGDIIQRLNQAAYMQNNIMLFQLAQRSIKWDRDPHFSLIKETPALYLFSQVQ